MIDDAIPVKAIPAPDFFTPSIVEKLDKAEALLKQLQAVWAGYQGNRTRTIEAWRLILEGAIAHVIDGILTDSSLEMYKEDYILAAVDAELMRRINDE